MTIKEYAAKHGISVRYVTKMALNGKIKGAFKNGKAWVLPDDIERKALPISNSDFRSIVENNHFVDKTLLIQKIIQAGPMVTLFTRPRRFGKTMALNMLRTFFERSNDDTLRYFENTKIYQVEECLKAAGRYPFVYLSFKQIKYNRYEDAYKKLYEVIKNEIKRLDSLYDLSFDPYFSREFDYVDITSFLEHVSIALHEKTGEKVIIAIDEYDVPITEGYLHGYYEEIIALIRTLFSGGFKDNDNLVYGFLTGVFRVAKESVFGGMNNLYVDSVVDGIYKDYFGYTEEEVAELLSYYGRKDQMKIAKDSYDGYCIQGSSLFNPWSVNNFIFSGFIRKPYWARTGSNDIIHEALDVHNETIVSSLKDLYNGKSVRLYINEGIIYPELKNNPTNVYSFLLFSGYLTSRREIEGGHCLYIPNEEIKEIFKEELLIGLQEIIGGNAIFELRSALMGNDATAFGKMVSSFLMTSVSYHDGSNESFYHGLTLGMLVLLHDAYEVTSNRESSFGRYDICLKARKPAYSSILIEVKHAERESSLRDSAQKALEQIQSKEYFKGLGEAGEVLLIGLSYHGKKAEIASKTIELGD